MKKHKFPHYQRRNEDQEKYTHIACKAQEEEEGGGRGAGGKTSEVETSKQFSHPYTI